MPTEFSAVSSGISVMPGAIGIDKGSASKMRAYYAYPAEALQFDPVSLGVRLSPTRCDMDYRMRVEVEGGAPIGTSNGDVDTSSVATVFWGDGSIAGTGILRIGAGRWYEAEGCAPVLLTPVEMRKAIMGYVSSDQFEPVTEYAFAGSVSRSEGKNVTQTVSLAAGASDLGQRSVACFGPGTMISTVQGDIPVEWLDTSDKVLTRDQGFQPILWIGRTRIPRGYFEQFPNEAPVCIPAGVLGPECPTRDLHVTGDHRIMLRSAQAELDFFSSEVLAPAKAWVDAGAASVLSPTGTFCVTHILCASHQLIVAEGAWVETMFTGEETLRRLSPNDRSRLTELLGSDLRHQKTARPCLSRKEARMLLHDMANLAA